MFRAARLADHLVTRPDSCAVHGAGALGTGKHTMPPVCHAIAPSLLSNLYGRGSADSCIVHGAGEFVTRGWMRRRARHCSQSAPLESRRLGRQPSLHLPLPDQSLKRSDSCAAHDAGGLAVPRMPVFLVTHAGPNGWGGCGLWTSMLDDNASQAVVPDMAMVRALAITPRPTCITVCDANRRGLQSSRCGGAAMQCRESSSSAASELGQLRWSCLTHAAR